MDSVSSPQRPAIIPSKIKIENTYEQSNY